MNFFQAPQANSAYKGRRYNPIVRQVVPQRGLQAGGLQQVMFSQPQVQPMIVLPYR